MEGEGMNEELFKQTDEDTKISSKTLHKWLDAIQKQASAYRNEDNGDESKWSMYNQGRADALVRMEWRLRKMLHDRE